MKKIGTPEPYNFHKTGSFGRFYSGNSFPVEFIQTSFTADELEDLTLAREIRPPEDIDFDLLIQRDIDEERVRREIEPYLNPKKTLAEQKAKAVFFPPLLAAVIPIQDKKMQYYYPNESGKLDEGFATREWPGLFKVKYFTSEGAHSYPIEVVVDGVQQKVNVEYEQVELGLRLVKGSQLGARLVVIDGQHRLFALSSILKKDASLIENLVLPICILFSPNCTEEKKNSYPVEIPTVPEVFRHLFVDVNKTVELVGGHFNILLSDNSISSLVCRRFCDIILKGELGQNGLAVIEWNTKTAKESTNIQRPYSITSIGIIDQALTESIGDNKYLVKYLLNLALVEDKLYPESSEIEHPTVAWNTFSLTQKKVLDDQVKEYLLPALKKIFFGSREYSKAYLIFVEELNKLKNIAKTGDTDEAIEAKGVLNQILEYIPIGASTSHDKERACYRKFEITIRDRREAEVAPIISYAIFQRAVILAWAELLKIGRQKNISVTDVTEAFVDLLDTSLKNRGSGLGFDKLYMQHSVFDASKIKPKSETKRALANLVLAPLGNQSVAKACVIKLNIGSKEETINEIIDFGQNKASEFIKHYEKERKKSFKGSYKVDFSIDKDDREELGTAEEEFKKQLKEVRDGIRNKGDVSPAFENLVDKYVKNDVDYASKLLKEYLGYSSDIVGLATDSDENGES